MVSREEHRGKVSYFTSTYTIKLDPGAIDWIEVVLQSNPITIWFGATIARRTKWAKIFFHAHCLAILSQKKKAISEFQRSMTAVTLVLEPYNL